MSENKKFGVNDLVFIRPDKVDSYFMLENPRGRVVRDSYNGMVKVEIFDTASQDTEGHNCTGKFAVGDISFQPFPVVPREAKPAAHPPKVWIIFRDATGEWRPLVSDERESYIGQQGEAYVDEAALQEAQERERLLTEALEKIRADDANNSWEEEAMRNYAIASETLAKIRGTNG